MNTILCPHCGETVELSHAFKAQYEQEIINREGEKHKKAIEDAKKQALDESSKKITEQFEVKLKIASENELANQLRNKELLELVTQLNKDLNDAKKQKEEVRLEMQKTLALEEDKIRHDAQKKAELEQHGKIAEKDKQLMSVMKELEDAKRKLQQGSQQTQGEAFELEFENMLRLQYGNDVITPVGKGIKGGDIIQEVWDKRGNLAGKILWELKNTKTWSEGWVDKLKTDQRSINAEEAVLISEILPTDMKVAGFRNGIWVTRQEFVLSLADTLRAKLIQLYYVRQSVEGKDEKMNILFSYLSGTEFKHRIEAIIESFTGMQTEIEKEKRYFSNKWARDEKNIRQVIDNTFGMHGDLKGIIGGVLPQIKGLDNLELESGPMEKGEVSQMDLLDQD